MDMSPVPTSSSYPYNSDSSNEQRPSILNSGMYRPIDWNLVSPQNGWVSNTPQHQWNHITPQPMPWAQPLDTQSQVMTFGSKPQPPEHSLQLYSQHQGVSVNRTTGSSTGTIHCKRKSEAEARTPAKQYITEEKMAAHMSRLHISSQTPQLADPSREPPEQRERRLVMCEEMRKLQTESVIPAALLNRCLKDQSTPNPRPRSTVNVTTSSYKNYCIPADYVSRLERPCMAVMLWQPPERKQSEFQSASGAPSSTASLFIDNNNSDSNQDRNNPSAPTNSDDAHMDMDL